MIFWCIHDPRKNTKTFKADFREIEKETALCQIKEMQVLAIESGIFFDMQCQVKEF